MAASGPLWPPDGALKFFVHPASAAGVAVARAQSARPQAGFLLRYWLKGFSESDARGSARSRVPSTGTREVASSPTRLHLQGFPGFALASRQTRGHYDGAPLRHCATTSRFRLLSPRRFMSLRLKGGPHALMQQARSRPDAKRGIERRPESAAHICGTNSAFVISWR